MIEAFDFEIGGKIIRGELVYRVRAPFDGGAFAYHRFSEFVADEASGELPKRLAMFARVLTKDKELGFSGDGTLRVTKQTKPV